MNDFSMILNECGSPNLIPDDRYELFGCTVRAWLSGSRLRDTEVSYIADVIAERSRAYAAAYAEFVQFDDCLRDEPWVIPEYDSASDTLRWLLIFKCDNNGNTYRFRYTAEEE